MFALYEALGTIGAFMASGSWVLTAIFVLTMAMWLLIFERLVYFKGQLRNEAEKAQSQWRARTDKQSWYAHQIRNALITQIHFQIDMPLAIIKTLVMLCPLFGLLGTVTGMIEVFEVMSMTEAGDVQALAKGVSKASIPAMAGMLAALSGVLGNTAVVHMASREKAFITDSLRPQ